MLLLVSRTRIRASSIARSWQGTRYVAIAPAYEYSVRTAQQTAIVLELLFAELLRNRL